MRGLGWVYEFTTNSKYKKWENKWFHTEKSCLKPACVWPNVQEHPQWCFENPASNLVTSWKRGGPWLRLLAKLPPSAPAVFLLAPGRANTGDMRRCPKIGDAPNGSKLVLGNYMIIKYWTGFRATFFSINSMFNDGHAHLRLSKRVCHGAARVDINSASHGIFFKTNVSEPYAQNQLRLIWILNCRSVGVLGILNTHGILKSYMYIIPLCIKWKGWCWQFYSDKSGGHDPPFRKCIYRIRDPKVFSSWQSL